MSERFFNTPDEEYDAASWLSTLKVMQRIGDRTEKQNCIAGRLCALVLNKPDEFFDEFRHIAAQGDGAETAEKGFLVEIGAASRSGRLARGLSDAALLLCSDPIGQQVREQSPFARLIPLVDEMADYCDEKFLRGVTHEDLKYIGYSTRLLHLRTEADFYIRQYDQPEVETAAISPLYL